MSRFDMDGVLQGVGDALQAVRTQTAEDMAALRTELGVTTAARIGEARTEIETGVRSSIGSALVADRSAELDRIRASLRLHERRARYEQIGNTVAGIVTEGHTFASRRLKKATAVISVDGRKMSTGTVASYDLTARKFVGATAAQLLDPMFAGSLEPLRKLVQRAVDRLPEGFPEDKVELTEALTKLQIETDHNLLRATGVLDEEIGSLRGQKKKLIEDLKDALDDLYRVERALADVRNWARAFSIGLRERRLPPVQESALRFKSAVTLGFEDTDPVATTRYLSKSFLDRSFGASDE